MITNPSKSVRKHPKPPSEKAKTKSKTLHFLKTVFWEKVSFPHKRKIPVGFPYQPRAIINVSRQKDAKSKVNMVENYVICVSFLCVKSCKTHFSKVGFQAFLWRVDINIKIGSKIDFLTQYDYFSLQYVYFLENKGPKRRRVRPSAEIHFRKTIFLKLNVPKSIVFMKSLDGTTIVGFYLVTIWSLFGRYLVAIWSLFGRYLVAIGRYLVAIVCYSSFWSLFGRYLMFLGRILWQL